MRTRLTRGIRAIASIRVSIVALLFLMAVVLLCTFDQLKIGIHEAVNRDIRSLWIRATIPGTDLHLPVFPGGALIGTVLLANFLANYVTRFRLSGRHLALWLTHAGVVVLIVGEFLTGMLSVETQLAIVEGETRNYTESTGEMELVAVEEGTDSDVIYSVPGRLLKRGAHFGAGAWPIEFRVREYMRNARLDPAPESGVNVATSGTGLLRQARSLTRTNGDEEPDHPATYVEVLHEGRSLGTWLVSTLIPAPQPVVAGGHTYTLELRPRRHYLPFAITLQDFRREMYPGTGIPKSFSSLVRVVDPAKGEDRESLIYMNNPLRYAGLTFYQASYGQDDRLSVLQVVRNPGWLLPYIACGLAAAGMLLHFTVSLAATRRVRT